MNVYISRTIFPGYLNELKHYEIIEEILASPAAFATKESAIKNAHLQCQEEIAQNYTPEGVDPDCLEIVEEVDSNDCTEVCLRYKAAHDDVIMIIHIQCIEIQQ